MSVKMNLETIPCCTPQIRGYRRLVFPDGSQVGVMGLDEIFDGACRQGKLPDPLVAKEMVDRLSESNYIPPGHFAQYEEVVLKEYQRFFEEKRGSKQEISII